MINPSDCKCGPERHCADPSCKSAARSRGRVPEVDRLFPALSKPLGLEPKMPFGMPPELHDHDSTSIRETFL